MKAKRCLACLPTPESATANQNASFDKTANQNAAYHLKKPIVVKLALSSTPAGTTMGRNERECGQMGDMSIAGVLGWIMDAPAAAAYAVLPVGVDMMRPTYSITIYYCTLNSCCELVLCDVESKALISMV